MADYIEINGRKWQKRTHGGYEIKRVLATDLEDPDYPVVLYVEGPDGFADVETYTINGQYVGVGGGPSGYDLVPYVEPPQPMTVYVNVWKSPDGDIYTVSSTSKTNIDENCADSKRRTLLHRAALTFVPGEKVTL